jgi:epoxyqueuosine reductase
MVGMNYAPHVSPLTWLHHKGHGAISAYALNQDYHDLMKSRLKVLARHLVTVGGGDVKVFVDTAPVMEKPLAQAAGLGWQGKHTVLVSRALGNWLFLGALFTTLKLPPDAPERDHCGRCTRCLDVCPTQAFPAPYQLDARRCLAYLTVEHKGHIAAQWRAPMSNRIYGCDDCLAVCPWNKFAQQAREIRLLPRQDLILPELYPYLTFDDPTFRAHFKGSPIKRIGRTRFLRNVLIALGNAPDERARPHIEALIHDEDARIRAMAIWAWARYVPLASFHEKAQRALPDEDDAFVRREWQNPWRLYDEETP